MNWFYRMMLLLLAFISMLMYFTIRSVNAPLPLVTEKYYEEEIKYQDKIDKISNSKTMNQQIDIFKTTLPLNKIVLNLIV